jgi:hypothetical protein
MLSLNGTFVNRDTVSLEHIKTVYKYEVKIYITLLLLYTQYHNNVLIVINSSRHL